MIGVDNVASLFIYIAPVNTCSAGWPHHIGSADGDVQRAIPARGSARQGVRAGKFLIRYHHVPGYAQLHS